MQPDCWEKPEKKIQAWTEFEEVSPSTELAQLHITST